MPLWLVSLFCLTIVCCSKNGPKNVTTPPTSKKTIGIAFGGGGAKGAAHIGVLKKLEELGIQADYVAGTSMGSVIAVLYAAGYTPKDLRRIMVEDRGLWIIDKTKKGKFKPGDGRKMTGVISRPTFQTKLDELLQRMEVHTYHDLEKKIPFKCTATAFTLTDFEEVVCENGVLARDVTSSISFPGAFVFCENKGKKLLDGGMMNNLPVDVVRAMGADIVIAIDLEQSDDDGTLIEFIQEGLSVAKQMSLLTGLIVDNFSGTKWFQQRPDKEKRKQNIANADIYIHPNLKPYDITDYDVKSIKAMIDSGYNACLEKSVAMKLERLLK